MKNLTSASKGILMSIVTMIAALVTNQGLPSTSGGSTVFLITVVGTILVYLGKNVVFPSVSILGSIDLRDVLSGLVLAIGSGLSNWVGTLVAGTPVNWHDLLVFIGSVVGGYFLKNFATKNPAP